ncbi:Dps family protein [Haloplasma contractile]|uniref:Ferroxidase protein n=1 Tax=Haloplasma contractile SSD-17B TaxID=1033810 RepID=U2EDP7_9MOLU|nr:DNA starvation/stationary phase protection protein [Haloplasma contractile]ERJ13108.1 Ferroxidase protein [Haloplasma contractile SSD-17B]
MANKTELTKLLNKEVANFGVLYTKLHNFHWYVKGKLFFQLHQKFEELYDETTGHFDEIAERILMLDEQPVATLKDFLELATIEEAKGTETTEEMIDSLLSDFEQLNNELGEGIEISEGLSDDVTADLLTGIRASLQKHIWMLKSTLK